MAFADRVFETSRTTGTGDLTLDGAVSGFRRFQDAFSVGDQVWYVISHRTLPEYEIGLGTVAAGGVLQRANSPALSSAASNAKVNFSEGKKEVRHTLPASVVNTLEAGGVDAHASTHATGGSDALTPAAIGAAAASHTHAIADVTNLQSSLNGKAAASHTHGLEDVSGLIAVLNDKSELGHGHAISDVSGLQTALNGKAATSHSHAISDVTGLQTALDGKAASTHSHAISDTTGLQDALDAKVATSALNELLDDRVADLIVAGSGISTSYNDAAGQYTISATGGGGSTDFSLTSNLSGLTTLPLQLLPDDLVYVVRESAGTNGGYKTTVEALRQSLGRQATNFLLNGGQDEFNRGGGTTTIVGSIGIEYRGFAADRWYTQWPTTNITFTRIASESLSGNRPALAANCTRIAPATSNAQYNYFQVLTLEQSVALRGSRVSGQCEFRWTHATTSNQLRPTIAILAYNGSANGSLRLRPYTANNPWTLRSGFTELASAQLPAATNGDGVWRQLSVQTSSTVPDDTTHLILMYRQAESGHLTTGTLEVDKFGLYPATQAQLWLPERRAVTALECRRHWETISPLFFIGVINGTNLNCILPIHPKAGAASTPSVGLGNVAHWQILGANLSAGDLVGIGSSQIVGSMLRLSLTSVDSLGTTGTCGYLQQATPGTGAIVINAENE